MAKNPPCIRNLERFRKTGCPQREWDGEQGCPAWIELAVPDPDHPVKRRIEKKCLDLWMFTLNWSQLGLLEGNQRAVESFRNGMVELGADGKAYPKPDPAMLHLVNEIERRRQLS